MTISSSEPVHIMNQPPAAAKHYLFASDFVQTSTFETTPAR